MIVEKNEQMNPNKSILNPPGHDITETTNKVVTSDASWTLVKSKSHWSLKQSHLFQQASKSNEPSK